MADTTTNYGLPIIDPKAKFNGAEDINELARRVDHVMQHVEEVGKDSHYTLPPATKTSLGGVIPGDNVTVKEDGTISVNVNPYELPPASHSTLGGVIVPTGSGLSLDPDGTIGIDNSVIGVPDGSVTTSKITDGAITTSKLATNAVTYEKLGSALQGEFDKVSQITSGTPENVPLDFTPQTSAISNVNLTCSYIAGIMILEGTLKLVANGSANQWVLCNPPFNDLNDGRFVGLPAVCAEAVDSSGNVYPMFFMPNEYGNNMLLATKGSVTLDLIPAGSYEVSIHATFFYAKELS